MRFLFIILLLLVSACVGTVQEAAAPQSIKFENPPATFSYTGLTAARGISHNRIELEFFPAPGGNDIRYKLYVNNAANPIEITPETLVPLAGGKLLYTLENLTPDREYKIKLRAFNQKTAAESVGEAEMFGKTFDNVVANFKGVARLSLVPGKTDRAIKVDWIAPTMSGVFTSGPFDPARYEITIVSEIGGPANLNNSTYNGTDKRVIPLPMAPARITPLSNQSSTEIEGLAADTTYYVQVRAINTLYQDFDDNPAFSTIPVSRELNTRYLSIKTDSGAQMLDFRRDNIVLANASGVDAYDKVDVFWQPARGSFNRYKVFYKKYTGTGDPAVDDKLTGSGFDSADVREVDSGTTTRRLTGLENNSVYQVKVVVCKESTCPLSSADTNAAIISDVKSIRVRPSLAPFTGINNIEPPALFSERDVVNLKFDPPLLATGFATGLEFYCVDPADYTRRVRFVGTTPISATGFGNCWGLALQGTPSPIANYSSQKVKGLIADGTRQYCFAATPIITGYGAEIRLPLGEMIVRCGYPEIFPPVINQFPGVNNTCSVTGTTANLSWTLPTGGIFSGFKVFWREKQSAIKFSLPRAVSDLDNYSSSPTLASNVVTHSIPNLAPGRTYEAAVLAQVELLSTAVGNITTTLGQTTITLTGVPAGFKNNWYLSVPGNGVSIPISRNGTNASGTSFTLARSLPAITSQPAFIVETLWSEYNIRVVDCTIPLPTANFKGFTRIFAIGPKIDGRVPNIRMATTKEPPASAALFEAIDSDGIPYEIPLLSPAVPSLTNRRLPPGRDAGTISSNFQEGFDGASQGSMGAMSNTGIVSLAWEEVGLSYAEAQSLFTANQPTGAPRPSRQWGYKVFRSSDNRLTWQELTAEHGHIYSMNFTYRNRPNSTDVTKRMGFFTDYSVKSLSQVHNSTLGQDIERARTYFYRIVPVFDGKILSYSSGSQHIVRVTLPPPNMALVHRWMANRAHCLTFNRDPDIARNYSCTYNGIGARPKSLPHRVDDTMLDQGGDLLVDRFELGCRFTRGHAIENAASGFSNFEIDRERPRPDVNHFPTFRGVRTIGDSLTAIEDENGKFMGCTGQHSESRDNPSDVTDSYPPSSPTLDIVQQSHFRFIQGDCMGSHSDIIATKQCTSPQYSGNRFDFVTFSVPGPNEIFKTSPQDCSTSVSSEPSHAESRYHGVWAPNKIMQSEFLAVFYNRHATSLISTSYFPWIEGPSSTSLSDTNRLNEQNYENNLSASQCSINLAAIDTEGYMKPRWIDVNSLGNKQIKFKGNNPVLNDLTVSQLTEVNASTTGPLTFYNGREEDSPPTAAAFKLPRAILRESNRYWDTTRVAKIYSSNSAKLPPLGRLNPDVAQTICRNYFVQTGIASSDGSTFAPNSPVLPKRLMRRWDSVIASSWPEHFTTTTIDSIEKFSNPGSCNNSDRNYRGEQIKRGSIIRNRIGSTDGSVLDSPILTGSSFYNGFQSHTDGSNTEKCISRFGVQDIPGNMAEVNSDRIFCDYKQDEIRVGDVSNGWAGGVNAVDKGDPMGVSIPYFNETDHRDKPLLESGRLITDPSTTVGFEIRFANGDPPLTSPPKPFVNISTDSGYCSVVDNDSNRRAEGEDVFKDADGNWMSVINPGGGVNTTIVENPQEDQDVIYTWRNGDGRFLDFGTKGIGAPLNYNNTLSLSNSGITPILGVTTQSKYFSPTLGIPLVCPTGACDNSSSDTTMVRADSLTAINPALDTAPSITDFPLGNSQIFNQGISEFRFDVDGYYEEPVPELDEESPSYSKIIEYVTVPSRAAMAEPNFGKRNNPNDLVFQYRDYPEDFISGDTIRVYDLRWLTPRNTTFGLVSGGGASTPFSGRFTASVSRVTGAIYGSREVDQGGRCAVMINQEP